MDRAMALPDFPPDFHVDLPPIPGSFFDYQHDQPDDSGSDIDRQNQLLLLSDPAAAAAASSCSDGDLDFSDWLPDFCCSDSSSSPFLGLDPEQPQRNNFSPSRSLSPRQSASSLSLSDESSSSQNNAADQMDYPYACIDLALAQQPPLSMPRSQQERQAAAALRPRSSKSGPTERMMDITLEELSQYFHMPITQASKELKVGLTVLKKRCREFGIPRWPHRKLKSLESLIHNIQELSKDSQGRKHFMDAVRELENQKRSMEESPGIELSERTKRLRQACFKQSYKQRRQALAKLEEEDDHD